MESEWHRDRMVQVQNIMEKECYGDGVGNTIENSNIFSLL